MKRTHYEILGIPRTADEAEIRRAFRRLAFDLHPDRGGDVDEAQLVNEARDVLLDPARRRRYDLALDGPPPRRGDDLLARVRIDLRLAAVGGATTLQILRDNLPPVAAPVVVPESAEIGTRWVIAGAGGEGRPAGDLVIELDGYLEGPLRRDGDDIHGDLAVTMAEAYAGATVLFDGARGAVALRLRPGEPPPPIVRVAGHGFRRAGDLVLRMSVRWPVAGDLALLRALQRTTFQAAG